jgi:hypothetical protein
MPTESLIIGEFAIFFGILAAFCIWQLVSVNKDIKHTNRKRAEQRASEPEPG